MLRVLQCYDVQQERGTTARPDSYPTEEYPTVLVEVYHEMLWESKYAEVERFDVDAFSERSDVFEKQSMIWLRTSLWVPIVSVR